MSDRQGAGAGVWGVMRPVQGQIRFAMVLAGLAAACAWRAWRAGRAGVGSGRHAG